MVKEWLGPIATPIEENVLPHVAQAVRTSVDTIETVMTLQQFFIMSFMLFILFMIPVVLSWFTPAACDIDGSELL